MVVTTLPPPHAQPTLKVSRNTPHSCIYCVFLRGHPASSEGGSDLAERTMFWLVAIALWPQEGRRLRKLDQCECISGYAAEIGTVCSEHNEQ